MKNNISLHGLVDYPNSVSIIHLNDNTTIDTYNKLFHLSGLKQPAKEVLNNLFEKKLNFKLDEYVYYSPTIDYKNIIKWTIQFYKALKSLNLEIKEYITYSDDINKLVQYRFIIKKL